VAGIALVALAAAVAVVFWWRPRVSQEPAAPRTAASALSNQGVVAPATAASVVNEQRLVGRWLRPDGGYVLEIRRARADQRLEASYFNPRPVNVSHAEWRDAGGKLGVFVELRDVNYPGATYTLTYVPEQDQLAGTYVQPAVQQSFEVVFTRQARP
jgi:hypothetical protein